MNATRQGLSRAISEGVYLRHTDLSEEITLHSQAEDIIIYVENATGGAPQSATRTNNWVQQGYKIQEQYTEIYVYMLATANINF